MKHTMFIKNAAATSSTGGKIIELPYGVGIKSFCTVTGVPTGSDTLTVTISEMDPAPASPTSSETATTLNYGSAFITHGPFTSGTSVPKVDVQDYIPIGKILSTLLHVKWAITGGTWNFRISLVIEDGAATPFITGTATTSYSGSIAKDVALANGSATHIVSGSYRRTLTLYNSNVSANQNIVWIGFDSGVTVNGGFALQPASVVGSPTAGTSATGVHQITFLDFTGDIWAFAATANQSVSVIGN